MYSRRVFMPNRFLSIAAMDVSFAASRMVAQAADTNGELTVHVDQPGATIGPMFYGLMTEEINHSYDGGLYAELIQNRIFKDARGRAPADPENPPHWSVVKKDSADGG